MLCRYCSSAYSPGDHSCQACGAPKGTIIQTVLDGSKAAAGRTPGYRPIAIGVVAITAATLGFHLLVDGARWLSPFSLLWAFFFTPVLLCAAVLISAKEGLLHAGINLVFSLGIWFGIMISSVVILTTGENTGGP